MTAACTIVSPNYLAFARVLSTSYLAHHPDHRFFVLIVADTADPTPFSGHSFTPVLLHELTLADLRGEAMKYDILELNTNVKPAFMAHLLARHSPDSPALDRLVYLDPDILVTAPLAPVFSALDAGADAVLTPHITAPIADDRSPSEQDHLYNGTYNLGFIAVRRSPETTRLLRWWSDRCLALGFSEGRTGLFVDQKWMNLAPGLFAGVHILRHPGCNMAYWNLQERDLQQPTLPQPSIPEPTPTPAGEGYCVRGPLGDTVPLCFFHFSGIDPLDPAQLSRHTNRFTLTGRPDLQPLFAAYRAALRDTRDPVAEAFPYGFDRLSDGTVITRLARRIFSRHQPRWQGTDPFAAAGPFARFARRHRLLAGKTLPENNTWSHFNRQDRRVLLLHRLLRTTLRLLGPNRYELLMRYLAHIAVLRNQSVFLDDPNDRDAPSTPQTPNTPKPGAAAQ